GRTERTRGRFRESIDRVDPAGPVFYCAEGTAPRPGGPDRPITKIRPLPIGQNSIPLNGPPMSLIEKTLEVSSSAHVRREAAQQAEFSLPPGFEPIELAGVGAFAEVWKVMETRAGRFAALKRLKPECCDDAMARQLIVNEWQASQSVASRHLL